MVLQMRFKTNPIKPYFGIAILVSITVMLLRFVIIYGLIPSGSMEPTIPAGSIFVGKRLLTGDTKKIHRGDIIIFRNDSISRETIVKRVIGLPGDIINIDNGGVSVNGEPLDERNYLPFGTITVPGKVSVFDVPENGFLVLGDHRDNSYDSRYWAASPFVTDEDIVAKVWWHTRIPFWNANATCKTKLVNLGIVLFLTLSVYLMVLRKIVKEIHLYTAYELKEKYTIPLLMSCTLAYAAINYKLISFYVRGLV